MEKSELSRYRDCLSSRIYKIRKDYAKYRIAKMHYTSLRYGLPRSDIPISLKDNMPRHFSLLACSTAIFCYFSLSAHASYILHVLLFLLSVGQGGCLTSFDSF